uniref:Endothelial cell surface expressed chemotaxis and apoptosis regulator n=1 Tax=Nannospalax galili TaxID=1026970 RepID=A0A8C6RCV8_NANGA
MRILLATYPADMGSIRAMLLCSAILGLLLLQGKRHLPLFYIPQKVSQGSVVSSKPVMPRSSTVDDRSPSLLGLMSPQPQKLTSGLGTRAPDGGSSSSSSSSSTRGGILTDSFLFPEKQNSLYSQSLSILNFLGKEIQDPYPCCPSSLSPVPSLSGVISFIVILVVVVLILAAVVSVRFKCQKNKESEDPQKPGNSGLSESCSTANGDKDSITLISMKNINMNNSKGCSSAEKVCFFISILP